MTETRRHPGALRADAEALASGLPALIARAEHLAATLSLGVHGRKRAGLGEDFWQYRQAEAGDDLRTIDWRRSAKGEQLFIRQKEWQTAQSVYLWVDPGASMQFGEESKAERARVLSIALSILLAKGGERFGLLNSEAPPRSGEGQISKIARSLAAQVPDEDYATLRPVALPKGSRAVFFSDFLGDWDQMRDALSRIAAQGVRGTLVQILDPSEIAFPFKGRTIFESMKQTLNFESRRADALRQEYLAKLEGRKDALRNLSRQTGWHVQTHVTDQSAQEFLLWLFNSLENG